MSRYRVRMTRAAEEDLLRLYDYLIERELAQGGDLSLAERAISAIRDALQVLATTPYTCRKADLGNGRSRELIIPFGGSGYILLFEIVGDDIVVGAVRHQREEDYRH